MAKQFFFYVFFGMLCTISESVLHLKLVMLQIGQEYQVGRFLVKPFKTYHTVPSQVRTAPPVLHCVCVYIEANCCVDAPICQVGKQSQHNVMSFACTSHHV